MDSTAPIEHDQALCKAKEVIIYTSLLSLTHFQMGLCCLQTCVTDQQHNHRYPHILELLPHLLHIFYPFPKIPIIHIMLYIDIISVQCFTNRPRLSRLFLNACPIWRTISPRFGPGTYTNCTDHYRNETTAISPPLSMFSMHRGPS